MSAPGRSTADTIRAVIVDQLDVPRELVTDAACLVDDLAADSLDLVSLTMALEETFKLEIPDQDAEESIGASSTVGGVIAYIEQRLAVRG